MNKTNLKTGNVAFSVFEKKFLQCWCKTTILLIWTTLVSGLGEYKDKYKDERSTMTYEINGNKWKITYLSSMYPDQPMVYDVEIGKPFDGKGPDGSDVKVCIIHDIIV